MTATQFLGQLRQMDVRLEVEDGALQVDAPEAVVTDEIYDLLRQHKAELLSLVTAEVGQDSAAWTCAICWRLRPRTQMERMTVGVGTWWRCHTEEEANCARATWERTATEREAAVRILGAERAAP
jgi:TubC N-terminal docking domain